MALPILEGISCRALRIVSRELPFIVPAGSQEEISGGYTPVSGRPP